MLAASLDLMSQAAPSVAAWLAALFFLLAGLNSMLRLADRFKEKPPPIQTYVQKADFHRQHGLLSDRLEQLSNELLRVREQDQEQINAVRHEMAQALREVHGRLDVLPAQIITILKNTGAIRS